MQTETASSNEDKYQVRKLKITDKNKGFMELLQQLTVCDPVVFIEKKFVRSCGKARHIEDVVVDSSTRGMQLGKKV
nr:hypothetical protein [Tanacetum cinerariifolium]